MHGSWPISKEDDNTTPGQFGLDAVIILPESQKAYKYGVDMLKDHVICVVVSFSNQGFVLSTQDLVFRDISVTGSLSGSNQLLREMVKFSAEHGTSRKLRHFRLRS
jgi:D-arabinose 1-dehydrogenase-like Zn-dependent alcohol dehydrogenase